MGMFDTVSDETIKRGECTDIYFIRTEEVLAREKVNPLVTMEVTAAALPDSWGIACGLSDVLALLSGVPVTVDAMPEGTLFYPANRCCASPGTTVTSTGTRPRSSGSSAMPPGSRLPPLISCAKQKAGPSIPLVPGGSTRLSQP